MVRNHSDVEILAIIKYWMKYISKINCFLCLADVDITAKIFKYTDKFLCVTILWDDSRGSGDGGVWCLHQKLWAFYLKNQPFVTVTKTYRTPRSLIGHSLLNIWSLIGWTAHGRWRWAADAAEKYERSELLYLPPCNNCVLYVTLVWCFFL